MVDDFWDATGLNRDEKLQRQPSFLYYLIIYLITGRPILTKISCG